MLKALAITGSNSHRSVQREAIEVGAQRPFHVRFVTCAAPDPNITLASAFARQRHALHRGGVQLEQQLLAVTSIGACIRISRIRILGPLPHLSQLAPHAVAHAAHQQGDIRIGDLCVLTPLHLTTAGLV